MQGALIIIAFGDRLRVFIGRYAQNLAKSLRKSQTSNLKPYLKSDFFYQHEWPLITINVHEFKLRNVLKNLIF